MICLMHEATPYGHLLINGRCPTDTQVAALLGIPSDQLIEIQDELEAAGVFSRTKDGVIYSRKMTRTMKKAATARKNGRKGGNPTLRNKMENLALDNQGDNQEVKPQSPEARVQKPEIKEDTNVSSKSTSKRKPKTKLREGWTLPKAWGDWAVSEGWPESTIRNEAARFYDYWFHERAGETKADWQATWRNWMRKVSKAPMRSGNVTHLNVDGRRWTMEAMNRRMDRMDELRREQGFDG